MSVHVSESQFEEFVMDAIDSLPDRFTQELSNISFFIEEEPFEDEDPELLGLYDGISLLERDLDYGLMGDFPDAIYIFKGPHERQFNSLEELKEEVRITVVHEVGHYFGMDEDQIERMGYA